MISHLNGVPLDFTDSESSPQSAISISVATHLGLSVTEDFCQCSVMVPTVDSIFISVLPFRIDASLTCPVLLGRDWIGLCQTVMADGLTVFPALSYEGSSGVQLNDTTGAST